MDLISPECCIQPSCEPHLPPLAPTRLKPHSKGIQDSSLLRLEIIKQDRPLLALLTPIPYNNTGAVDHLAGIPFAIEHT